MLQLFARDTELLTLGHAGDWDEVAELADASCRQVALKRMPKALDAGGDEATN